MTGRWAGLVASGAVGYLAGLLPSADLAARAASGGTVDLRRDGTGNPGGANAVGVLGTRWGLAVMAADITKGALAARAGRRIAGDAGQHIAAVASVVGHCYPVSRGFRGGKGVGCSVGQCLATLPAYLPLDVAVAAAVSTGRWRDSGFAATAASSSVWVTASLLWWRRGWPNAWGGRPTVGHPIAAAVSSTVILHRFWIAARRAASAG